jgi:hypothetical protein
MLGVANKPFILSVIMLNVVMLSVIMLSVVKLNVVMLSVFMLNVVVPYFLNGPRVCAIRLLQP